MGTIERLMIEAMARHPEGLTPEEALDAIVPPDRPKLRLRPAYKYCFDRLNSRHMVDWVAAKNAVFHAPNDGVLRYRPSEKAMAKLRRSIDAQLKPDGVKMTAEEKERPSQHQNATISGFKSVTFVP